MEKKSKIERPPYLKYGQTFWYDCDPYDQHHFVRGKIIQVLGESDGYWELRVDWGKYGWPKPGDYPAVIYYDPKDAENYYPQFAFENVKDRKNIRHILQQAVRQLHSAGYANARLTQDLLRLGITVTPPGETWESGCKPKKTLDSPKAGNII